MRPTVINGREESNGIDSLLLTLISFSLGLLNTRHEILFVSFVPIMFLIFLCFWTCNYLLLHLPWLLFFSFYYPLLRFSCLHMYSQGLVKLADFGVATKLNEADVNTHSVVGTPYWMAPEVYICLYFMYKLFRFI